MIAETGASQHSMVIVLGGCVAGDGVGTPEIYQKSFIFSFSVQFASVPSKFPPQSLSATTMARACTFSTGTPGVLATVRHSTAFCLRIVKCLRMQVGQRRYSAVLGGRDFQSL
jgi:hypothetical protein